IRWASVSSEIVKKRSTANSQAATSVGQLRELLFQPLDCGLLLRKYALHLSDLFRVHGGAGLAAADLRARVQHSPARDKHSKRTKAEHPAESIQPTKGTGKAQGKAAKAKPAPQPGMWLNRDCNAALDMQRIGVSRWRPLELCYWPEQAALPVKGKEYPGLRYKRLRYQPSKDQEQQQQPTVAQQCVSHTTAGLNKRILRATILPTGLRLSGALAYSASCTSSTIINASGPEPSPPITAQFAQATTRISSCAAHYPLVQDPSSGKLLAIADQEGFVTILQTDRILPYSVRLDPGGQRPRAAWEAHKNLVHDLCWAKADSRLYTASGDSTVAVWDTSCATRLATGVEHQLSVKCLTTFGPGGDVFASGSRDGSILVWDVRLPGRRARMADGSSASTLACVWKAEGAHKVVGATPSRGNAGRGRTPVRSASQQQGVTSVVWLPHTSFLLASAGERCSLVKYWDLRCTASCPVDGLCTAASTGSGQLAAAGSLGLERSGSLGRASSGETPSGSSGHPGTKRTRGGTPRSQGSQPAGLQDLLFSFLGCRGPGAGDGGAGGTPATGAVSQGILSLSVTPQGDRLLVHCASGPHLLFSARAPQSGALATFHYPPSAHPANNRHKWFIRTAFSPDGTAFLAGAADSAAYVWQVDCPQRPPLALGGHDGCVGPVAWCPSDPCQLATGCDSGSLRLWRLSPELASPLDLDADLQGGGSGGGSQMQPDPDQGCPDVGGKGGGAAAAGTSAAGGQGAGLQPEGAPPGSQLLGGPGQSSQDPVTPHHTPCHTTHHTSECDDPVVTAHITALSGVSLQLSQHPSTQQQQLPSSCGAEGVGKEVPAAPLAKGGVAGSLGCWLSGSPEDSAAEPLGEDSKHKEAAGATNIADVAAGTTGAGWAAAPPAAPTTSLRASARAVAPTPSVTAAGPFLSSSAVPQSSASSALGTAPGGTPPPPPPALPPAPLAVAAHPLATSPAAIAMRAAAARAAMARAAAAQANAAARLPAPPPPAACPSSSPSTAPPTRQTSSPAAPPRHLSFSSLPPLPPQRPCPNSASSSPSPRSPTSTTTHMAFEEPPADFDFDADFDDKENKQPEHPLAPFPLTTQFNRAGAGAGGTPSASPSPRPSPRARQTPGRTQPSSPSPSALPAGAVSSGGSRGPAVSDSSWVSPSPALGYPQQQPRSGGAVSGVSSRSPSPTQGRAAAHMAALGNGWVPSPAGAAGISGVNGALLSGPAAGASTAATNSPISPTTQTGPASVLPAPSALTLAVPPPALPPAAHPSRAARQVLGQVPGPPLAPSPGGLGSTSPASLAAALLPPAPELHSPRYRPGTLATAPQLLSSLMSSPRPQALAAGGGGLASLMPCSPRLPDLVLPAGLSAEFGAGSSAVLLSLQSQSLFSPRYLAPAAVVGAPGQGLLPTLSHRSKCWGSKGRSRHPAPSQQQQQQGQQEGEIHGQQQGGKEEGQQRGQEQQRGQQQGHQDQDLGIQYAAAAIAAPGSLDSKLPSHSEEPAGTGHSLEAPGAPGAVSVAGGPAAAAAATGSDESGHTAPNTSGAGRQWAAAAAAEGGLGLGAGSSQKAAPAAASIQSEKYHTEAVTVTMHAAAVVAVEQVVSKLPGSDMHTAAELGSEQQAVGLRRQQQQSSSSSQGSGQRPSRKRARPTSILQYIHTHSHAPLVAGGGAAGAGGGAGVQGDAGAWVMGGAGVGVGASSSLGPGAACASGAVAWVGLAARVGAAAGSASRVGAELDAEGASGVKAEVGAGSGSVAGVGGSAGAPRGAGASHSTTEGHALPVAGAAAATAPTPVDQAPPLSLFDHLIAQPPQPPQPPQQPEPLQAPNPADDRQVARPLSRFFPSLPRAPPKLPWLAPPRQRAELLEQLGGTAPAPSPADLLGEPKPDQALAAGGETGGRRAAGGAGGDPAFTAADWPPAASSTAGLCHAHPPSTMAAKACNVSGSRGPPLDHQHAWSLQPPDSPLSLTPPAALGTDFHAPPSPPSPPDLPGLAPPSMVLTPSAAHRLPCPPPASPSSSSGIEGVGSGGRSGGGECGSPGGSRCSTPTSSQQPPSPARAQGGLLGLSSVVQGCLGSWEGSWRAAAEVAMTRTPPSAERDRGVPAALQQQAPALSSPPPAPPGVLGQTRQGSKGGGMEASPPHPSSPAKTVLGARSAASNWPLTSLPPPSCLPPPPATASCAATQAGPLPAAAAAAAWGGGPPPLVQRTTAALGRGAGGGWPMPCASTLTPCSQALPGGRWGSRPAAAAAPSAGGEGRRGGEADDDSAYSPTIATPVDQLANMTPFGRSPFACFTAATGSDGSFRAPGGSVRSTAARQASPFASILHTARGPGLFSPAATTLTTLTAATNSLPPGLRSCGASIPRPFAWAAGAGSLAGAGAGGVACPSPCPCPSPSPSGPRGAAGGGGPPAAPPGRTFAWAGGPSGGAPLGVRASAGGSARAFGWAAQGGQAVSAATGQAVVAAAATSESGVLEGETGAGQAAEGEEQEEEGVATPGEGPAAKRARHAVEPSPSPGTSSSQQQLELMRRPGSATKVAGRPGPLGLEGQLP
ncbi:hypothetical protein QJQ45_018646, partial [Haematococcus lacustris]